MSRLLFIFYTHTYIIGHYIASVRIIDLVTHITYVVCVNFIHKWPDRLKSTPNDRFFKKLFMTILFTLKVFARNLLREEIAEEILFVFRFGVWSGTRSLAFRLISQHAPYQTMATSIFFFIFYTTWYSFIAALLRVLVKW